MYRAVFFDRDGVINRDLGYVGRLDDFELLPGVVTTLRQVRESGYLRVLVTNQSGIARGLYSEADFLCISAFLQQRLALHGAQFDAIYYCPHHPEARLSAYRRCCSCRKPASGMFERAARELKLDLAECVCCGDRLRDLEGAAAVGVSGLYLIGSKAEALPPGVKRLPTIEALTAELIPGFDAYSAAVSDMSADAHLKFLKSLKPQKPQKQLRPEKPDALLPECAYAVRPVL